MLRVSRKIKVVPYEELSVRVQKWVLGRETNTTWAQDTRGWFADHGVGITDFNLVKEKVTLVVDYPRAAKWFGEVADAAIREAARRFRRSGYQNSFRLALKKYVLRSLIKALTRGKVYSIETGIEYAQVPEAKFPIFKYSELSSRVQKKVEAQSMHLEGVLDELRYLGITVGSEGEVTVDEDLFYDAVDSDSDIRFQAIYYVEPTDLVQAVTPVVHDLIAVLAALL